MTQKRTFLITTTALFIVLFNLGFVFHDLLLGDWFHEQEGPIAREHFIVPLIGLAFLVYSLVLAHLFPIYRRYYAHRSLTSVALSFGIMMGLVFDALQGGIIEYATMNLPIEVFLVDSGYHVFIEGSLAGLVLMLVHRRAEAAA